MKTRQSHKAGPITLSSTNSAAQATGAAEQTAEAEISRGRGAGLRWTSPHAKTTKRKAKVVQSDLSDRIGGKRARTKSQWETSGLQGPPDQITHQGVSSVVLVKCKADRKWPLHCSPGVAGELHHGLVREWRRLYLPKPGETRQSVRWESCLIANEENMDDLRQVLAILSSDHHCTAHQLTPSRSIPLTHQG
mmetsp:Transcript_18806/g.29361  ORF Transcript_18806/g.29361 Transcript_18806/m.29361 type:complete len:192 (+) Transcript_18806:368-943(+)